MPEFDRELLEHIHCFSAQAEDQQEWVDPHLSGDIDGKS